MAQMLDNAKQKGGYHVYGSAKKIDELQKKKDSGKALTDDEKKYLNNRRNQNLGNEETGGVENTGGGDPISKGEEFLVASNTEEADEMRDRTNGDIAVRVQQDRNDDGTFATDDRNDGNKSNIGKSNLYRMTAPKSQDEWKKLARKDPQEFAATVELYLNRLEISITREDFADMSKQLDDKASQRIRQIAVENNKKNLEKIRNLVAQSGNESALKKMDSSLKNHNKAVLKKMGFDPNEILGSDEEETVEETTPIYQKEKNVETKQEEVKQETVPSSSEEFTEQELNDAKNVVAYKLNLKMKESPIGFTKYAKENNITVPAIGQQFNSSNVPDSLVMEQARNNRKSEQISKGE